MSNCICIWSDIDGSCETSQFEIVLDMNGVAKVRSSTSFLIAFIKVGLLPLLIMSKLLVTKYSKRYSPLLLLSVLPQIVWCALASQLRIRCLFLLLHQLTRFCTISGGGFWVSPGKYAEAITACLFPLLVGISTAAATKSLDINSGIGTKLIDLLNNRAALGVS